jgi:DNA-binding LacI/PurR family transcriptional regulator
VWGSHRDGQVHCTVGTDNFAGGRMSANHLIHKGAGKLAFFGDTRGPEIEQRLAGARHAVAQAGGVTLKVFPTQLSSEELGQQISAHLDQLDGNFDGIVAATDVIAMVTIQKLHERGIAVPGAVRVAGYDDLPLATQTVPQLTTIRQDIAGGAHTMVASLYRRLAGEDAPSTVMMPELIVRASA